MQAPTGPFACGITDLHYFDPTADSLQASKHLTARLYFPTSRATAATKRWFSSPPWLPFFYSARAYALFPFITKSGWIISLIKGIVTLLVLAIGATVRIAGEWNAPVISADEQGKELKNTRLPLVIFSHGLAGQRTTYSSLCLEMASRGFFVVAIEHADGTASLAELSGPANKMKWQPSKFENPRDAKGTWRWFGGLGEHIKLGRPQFRLEEVKLSIQLMSSLTSGSTVDGLRIASCSKRHPEKDFVAGRIDLDKIIVAGHSYGGATAAWAASCVPGVVAGISLDPWWEALPEDAAVLTTWINKSPLLVIGSEEWNMPLENTTTPETAAEGSTPLIPKMNCGYERRERVMDTAGKSGAGCLRVVPRHSNHHSFNDVLLVMEKRGAMSVASCLSFPKPKVSPTEMHLRITRIVEIFLRDVISSRSSDQDALTKDDCTSEYRAALSREADMVYEIALSNAVVNCKWSDFSTSVQEQPTDHDVIKVNVDSR